MKKIIIILNLILSLLFIVSCQKMRDQVPTITFKQPIDDNKIEVLQGTYFDPLSLIFATDKEDGDLTDKVEVSGYNGSNYYGDQFEVTYSISDSKNHFVSVSITIIIVKADSLRLVTPSKLVFLRNEHFTYDGLEIYAKRNNIEKLLDKGEYSIINENLLTSAWGQVQVTIEACGLNTSYQITVDSQDYVENLESLSVNGEYKTVYYRNQDLNLDGLIINAHFVDSSVETIALSDCVVLGFSSYAVGINAVTIYYGGKSVVLSFEILEASQPVLNNVEKHMEYFSNDSSFNILKGITAYDPHDGDITENITISGKYYLNIEGTYSLSISVSNSSKIVSTQQVILKVVIVNVPLVLPTYSSPSNPIVISVSHAMNTDLVLPVFMKYAKSFEDFYKAQGYYFKVVVEDGFVNYDLLKDNILSRLVAGIPLPNITQGYPDSIVDYMPANAVLSLSPYIYDNNYGIDKPWGFDKIQGYEQEDDTAYPLEDILDIYLKENSQYNEYKTFYSLPFNKSTEIYVYNKTAFNALGLTPPDTWQELFEMSSQLKQYAYQLALNKGLSENQARALTGAAGWDSPGNAFTTIVKQFGGTYTGYDVENKKGEILFNTETNKNIFEMFRQYGSPQNASYLTPNSRTILFPSYYSQNYCDTPFIDQNILISISSTASILYKGPNATNLEFEIGAHPMLYNGDTNKHSAIQQGTNMSLLNGGTDDQKLVSWLFLKWLARTENTVDFAINTGYMPIRTSGFLSERYQNYLNGIGFDIYKPNGQYSNSYYTSLAAKAAYQQKDYLFFDYAFNGAARTRTMVASAFERIMLGDGNITVALQHAYDEIFL